MQFRIVIPTYKENDQLRKCLQSLDSFDLIQNVLVVDDNDDEYCLETDYDVEILKTNGNAWWSGSVNLGLKDSFDKGYRQVILLNSDNWIKDDIIRPLAELCEQNRNIIHAATVVNEKNRIRCTSGYLNLNTYKPIMHNHKMHINELGSATYYGNYNGGMAVALSSTVVKKVGYLDERFPLSADKEYFYRSFTMGVIVCAYEKYRVYTDDMHKAIARGKRSSKLFHIANKRSSMYYRSIYEFYKTYSTSPFLDMLIVIFKHYMSWIK